MGRQRGRVRRNAVAAFAVCGLIAAATIAVTVGSASATTTYDQYEVFGTNSVHIGFESTVTGLVGSVNNRVAPAPNPSEALHLSGGAHIVGDARIVQDVDLQNQTGISGTVTYAGTLTKQATSTIGTINHVANAAAVDLPSGPIPTEWPNAAQYCATNHTPDIIDGNSSTITLTPGNWGDIKAGGTSTLNFNGAGDYYVDNIDFGSGVTINFTKGMRLFVCAKVELGKITSTNQAGYVPSDVYTEVAGIPAPSDTNGFEVDTGPWVGDIVTPTTGIHYGSGGSGSSSILGHLWGEHIDLEHSVEVSSPQETTTTSTTFGNNSSSSSSSSSSTSSSSTSSSTSSTSTSSTSTSTIPVTSSTTTIPVTSTTTANDSSTTSTSTSTSMPQSTTTITEAGSTSTTTIPVTSTTTANETSTIPQSTTTITEAGSTVATTSTIVANGSTTTVAHGTLPFTGGGGGAVPFALISLLAGGALLIGSRRRKAVRTHSA